jgi:hypothetical protein
MTRARSSRVLCLLAAPGLLLGSPAGIAHAATAQSDRPSLVQPVPAGTGFTTPEEVAYSFVKDSSGKTVGPGDAVSLLFAAQGVLWLLATSSGGDLSYQGTWAYRGDRLTIAIDSGGFDRHGSFGAHLGASTVTVPFQVFSASPGSSTWAEEAIDPITTAFSVAIADDSATGNGLSLASVIADAAGYVSSLTGAALKGSTTSAGDVATSAEELRQAALTDPPRRRIGDFGGRRQMLYQPALALGGGRHLHPSSIFDTGVKAVDLEPLRRGLQRRHG